LADDPDTCFSRPFRGTSQFRQLSVLMPILNERWTLRSIVERVLNAPVPMEIELVAVDDGSTDGSWELLQELAAEDSRVRIFRHDRNRGKGAAVRTAIEQMSGDVAVVQDADLEYEPEEYPILLGPLLDGRADAVFGSRFAGHERRVLFYWHALANSILTTMSNMLNNLNLTDMETCFKMVRADILRELRLSSNTFTFEPELTCRLAQWGARIYEVPISYHGRTFEEGKKIRLRDAFKAVWAMCRCRFFDTQFTSDSGFFTLKSVSRSKKYNRWTLLEVAPFLGARLMEAGSGIGNLSSLLLNRERLLLVDYRADYVQQLHHRYGRRGNVRVDQGDLTNPRDYSRWQGENLDTILCSNVLEHLKPDQRVLESFCETLVPGGHCIIVVPTGQWLYTGVDASLGHWRRYSAGQLRERMEAAGFEVVFEKQFNRMGSLGWAANGHLLRRRELRPGQMILFDRLMPLARLLENVLPVPGMSLIMVGRKPSKSALRIAA
jgi:glycosyltransferase involved in cell wall biosynthesis